MLKISLAAEFVARVWLMMAASAAGLRQRASTAEKPGISRRPPADSLSPGACTAAQLMWLLRNQWAESCRRT